MHPNIDERTERRDVGDDARQWHSRLDIGDGVDAFGEMKDFETARGYDRVWRAPRECHPTWEIRHALTSNAPDQCALAGPPGA